MAWERAIKNKIYDWLAPRHYRASVERLRRMEYLLPESTVRFAIPWTFKGLGHFKHLTVYQHPVELHELYKMLLKIVPRSVLEIGTARGGTLYLWTQAAAADANLMSIDLPGGPFGGGYPECRIPFYTKFARPAQRLELVRQNSHHAATVARAANYFTSTSVEFLFIDADHSFTGICNNLLLYASLVRAGGWIGLHDILPNPRYPQIQVWKLWQSIRTLPYTREIIDSDGCPRPLGIGLINVPAGGAEELLDTVRLASSAADVPVVDADQPASSAAACSSNQSVT